MTPDVQRALAPLRRSRGGLVEAAVSSLRRSPARRAVQWRRHRGLLPTDAYLASFPRSGNTWLRFVLADLATGSTPDFVSVDRTIPNVGEQEAAPRVLPRGGRLIKTHEAWREEYRRGIYLIRDPRDVLLSWFHLLSPGPPNPSDLDGFVADFAAGRTSGYGRWEDHVRGWLRAADRHPGIRVERFEVMRTDMAGFTAEACRLLGLEVGEDRVREAVAANSKERMRELEEQDAGYLERFGRRTGGVREGRVGSWRDWLSDRQLRHLAPLMELAAELGYPPV